MNAGGIPIGTQAFRALVTGYLDRMKRDETFGVEDYATMTRLWNTIQHRRLEASDALYREYASAYFPGYVERASKILNALPTKGMALYSKEHDLFIGGNPHASSQYALDDAAADRS